MAAKSRGRNLRQVPILQPGAVILDEQDFSLKGHAVFEADIALYADRPKRGDAHPLDRNCLLYSVQSTSLKLKKIRFECDYIGLSIDPTPYFLEFIGSVGEEPIETHPNFVSVIGGTPSNPLHGAQFDQDTGEFLGFPVGFKTTKPSDDLAGVRSYFRPSCVVRISYWTKKKPNPGPLGHVIDPATIPDLVLPPNCKDLLVTNFTYRTLTPSQPPFQITVELLASGINGWNQLIYPLA